MKCKQVEEDKWWVAEEMATGGAQANSSTWGLRWWSHDLRLTSRLAIYLCCDSVVMLVWMHLLFRWCCCQLHIKNTFNFDPPALVLNDAGPDHVVSIAESKKEVPSSEWGQNWSCPWAAYQNGGMMNDSCSFYKTLRPGAPTCGSSEGSFWNNGRDCWIGKINGVFCGLPLGRTSAIPVDSCCKSCQWCESPLSRPFFQYVHFWPRIHLC